MNAQSLPLNLAITHATQRGNYDWVWLRFPVLTVEGRWQLSHATEEAVRRIVEPLGEWRPSTVRLRRQAKQIPAWSVPDGDALCRPIFGLTALQVFNRHMRHHKLWAIDRGGRGGTWWCEVPELPLHVIPRHRSWHPCGRIPPEWRWIFDPMLRSEQADYSLLDLGPDRLPPVWECNLCGRAAERDGWTWRTPPGVANAHHIVSCPGCGAARDSNELGALVDRIKGEGFIPRMRMQDDYLLTA